jgi:hypothetical protein
MSKEPKTILAAHLWDLAPSLIGEGQDATEPLRARIFKKHRQDGDVLNQTQMMCILTCHDIPCWLHVHVLGCYTIHSNCAKYQVISEYMCSNNGCTMVYTLIFTSIACTEPTYG